MFTLYIYSTSQKYLVIHKNTFLIQKISFFIKQIKHHKAFIYNTKWKSFTVTFYFNVTRYLLKNRFEGIFLLYVPCPVVKS